MTADKNTVANRKVICDVLLEHAKMDKQITVLCSDSRGSASMTPLRMPTRTSLWRWGSRSRIWFRWQPAWRTVERSLTLFRLPAFFLPDPMSSARLMWHIPIPT